MRRRRGRGLGLGGRELLTGNACRGGGMMRRRRKGACWRRQGVGGGRRWTVCYVNASFTYKVSLCVCIDFLNQIKFCTINNTRKIMQVTREVSYLFDLKKKQTFCKKNYSFFLRQELD